MKNFEYYAPTKVYFGKGQEERVGEITKSYGFKKVLIHYGGGSIKKTGLYDKVVKSLDDAGIAHIELGGVQPNPLLSLAKKGIEMCRAENVDLVLSVGGGSALDSAKIIADGVMNDIDPWEFSMKRAVPKAALPVACILTLAATGSEMSASAVITNDELKLKRGFNSETHRPLFSILNPELTYTLPPYQTACGIVDIMMHTLERYITKPGEAELTDRIAESLLKTVIESGKIAMEDPTNYEARANIMWAGSLSHNDLTGEGREFFMVSHQLEHEVSGIDDRIAHGAGLAVIFPAWCRYVYKYDIPKFCQYAVRVWNCEMDYAHPEKTALAGIEATEAYFKSIGMPSKLSEFGLTKDCIPEMTEKCTNFGTRTLPSYIEFGAKEIAELYELCF
nr:iron-containing alcohol dehydrogenase [Clostridia bacterium]